MGEIMSVPLISATTCFLVIAVIGGIIYFKKCVKFISKDEQLLVEQLTSQEVHSGPTVIYLNPFLVKEAKVFKALSLAHMEYCIIKNTVTGERRIQEGPTLVTLLPYDEIEKAKYGQSIDEERLKRRAISLKANEFVRLIDKQSGKVRVVKGEASVIPTVDEEFLDSSGKLLAMNLSAWEYVKVQDLNTGKIRTERGEKLVFLGPSEEYIEGKKAAIEIDDETAVLLRNKRTGQQRLVTEKKLFIPDSDEDIIEVRHLIKLADYEACIIRDKTGADSFYFGRNENERSFFLPPHSHLVKLLWSRGRRREYRDLEITKLDLRPMFMSFEFNCRTNDNVELILEGSFFWEVVDLKSMIQFTCDTTGDVCNHARSRFIELVSRVTLQEFMHKFNVIAEEVHSNDKSNFYSQRGVKIHSLEVTGYRCAERSTAAILEQIIQETTNRMNKLQQQESENEVQLREIEGDIEEEKARGDLIKIQTENSNAKARMEGLAEAERVKSFLNSIPNMDIHEKISLWKTLRKEDALRAVSSGNARLYFTPKDVNLSIENHEHVSKNKNSCWADDSASDE